MARKKKKVEEAPKKINRRNSDKFSAVKPEFNLKIRQEEIEDIAEYFDKLPLDVKRWMNKFTEEYVNDKLDRKNLSKNLHNTKELKQSCDARNNKRNRDVYSLYKSKGDINYIEDFRGLENKFNQDEKELEETFEFNNSTNKTDEDTENS